MSVEGAKIIECVNQNWGQEYQKKCIMLYDLLELTKNVRFLKLK